MNTAGMAWIYITDDNGQEDRFFKNVDGKIKDELDNEVELNILLKMFTVQ